jgi:hypothetical protein
MVRGTMACTQKVFFFFFYFLIMQLEISHDYMSHMAICGSSHHQVLKFSLAVSTIGCELYFIKQMLSIRISYFPFIVYIYIYIYIYINHNLATWLNRPIILFKIIQYVIYLG